MKAAAIALALALSACGGPEFADDPFSAVAQIEGEACGRDVVASSVVIRDELMLTAAHNVAGASGAFTVTFADGESFLAEIVGFDTDRDVAFLRTQGMHRLPIRMADPTDGDSGMVLRLRAGSADRVPYTHTEVLAAVGHDIFDEPSSVKRDVIRIDADIGAGFSGAPVLSSEGTLVGMVNARSRGSSEIYAVSTSEIREAFAATDLTTVEDTTRCAP